VLEKTKTQFHFLIFPPRIEPIINLSLKKGHWLGHLFTFVLLGSWNFSLDHILVLIQQN